MAYGITLSFAEELLSGVHDFSADTFKMALYTTALSQSITAYTATNEVSGDGYTAGGQEIAFSLSTSDGVTSLLLADETIYTPSAATSFLIYNDTKANRSVLVAPLGDQVTTAGTITASWNVPLLSITV